MADKLTAKQESFAQLIAQGKNQAEAYRETYKSKASDNAVYVNASKLAASAKVSLRIKELKRQNENTAIWTREDALRRLLVVAQEAQEATSEPIMDRDGNQVGVKYNAGAGNVIVKAVEAASKMCGYNEPDKTDTTVKFNNIEEFLKVAGESEY